MRSIEYLAQLFPDKTGKELFEIQKQDKEDDQHNYELQNKAKLDLIKVINEDGGYWKGTFGLDQKFIWSFSNMELIGGDIMCEVTAIDIVFINGSVESIKQNRMKREIFDDFNVEIYQRSNKAEFDKISDFINNTKSFWED